MLLITVLAILGAACSPGNSAVDVADSQSNDLSDEAFQLLLENYPSRDQMLDVRACTTSRTEYAFPDLPEDFGPIYATDPPDDYVAQARQGLTTEVEDAFTECVFELGYEDNFYPPDTQEDIRNAKDN